MQKYKRKPKQDFSINFEEINTCDLHKVEKTILLRVLNHHKKYCKKEFTNLYNKDLCEQAEISENTLLKYRKNLVLNKYFTIKQVRTGSAFVIQYRFNWRKLTTKNYIEQLQPIENKFKPVFNKKVPSQSFKKGEILTFEDKVKIVDTSFYEMRVYVLNREGTVSGNGRTQNICGDTLKKLANQVGKEFANSQYRFAKDY